MKFLKQCSVVLIAATIFGCQQSAYESIPQPNVTQLIASTAAEGVDTRVNLEQEVDEIVVTWRNVEGDKDVITVYDAAGDRVGDFTYSGDDNQKSGKFVGEATLTEGNDYTAVYPSSSALTLNARNAEALSFADQVSAQETEISTINDAVLMKSEFNYSPTGTITFVHEMAILVITINTQTYNKPSYIEYSDSSEGVTYRVDYSTGVGAKQNIKTYMAVHPTNGTRTVSFKLVYDGGLEWIFSAPVTKSYEAGMFYSMAVGDSQELIITTAEQLKAFADDVNAGYDYMGKTVKLRSNLNLSSYSNWPAIGTEYAPFKGEFDGGNHTISNLTITSAAYNGQGLFGRVVGGTVKDVVLDSPQINSAFENTGAVVGFASDNSLIENCRVVNGGTIESTKTTSILGGVVGQISGTTTVTSCSNSATLSAEDEVGGIVGRVLTNSTVSNCYNTGTVVGDNMVGGVSGNNSGESITLSYNVGAISGTSQIGGIAGKSASSTISNCYNSSSVTGSTTRGGIVGSATSTTLTNNFYIWGSDIGSNTEGSQRLLTAEELNNLVGSNDGLADDYSKATSPEVNLPSISGESNVWTPDPSVAIVDSASDLRNIAIAVNAGNTYDGKTIILTESISLSSYSNWTPIGTIDNRFNGVFEGGDNTISGLKITSTSASGAGLFGGLDGAIVRDVTISSPQITSSNGTVGAVAGSVKGNALIENCQIVGGTITSSADQSYVGSVVGSLASSTVNLCSSSATVTGNSMTGGIVGSMTSDAQVTRCYNRGTVSGTSNVGGIVGGTTNGKLISLCYNIGRVTSRTGSSAVAGIVGSSYSSDISYCYNTGTITSTQASATPIVGYSSNHFGPYTYTNNFYVWPSNLGATVSGIGRVSSVQLLNDKVGVSGGLPSGTGNYTKGSPTSTYLPSLMGEKLQKL